MKKMFLVLALLGAPAAFAHDGHDHGPTPGPAPVPAGPPAQVQPVLPTTFTSDQLRNLKTDGSEQRAPGAFTPSWRLIEALPSLQPAMHELDVQRAGVPPLE